jgi:hypothetical protein
MRAPQLLKMKRLEPVDVAQVCTNGHVVNSFSVWASSQNQNFCPECGAKTQTQCAQCGNVIRGGFLHLGLFDPDTGEQHVIGRENVKSIPRHCSKCGNAFPWAATPQPVNASQSNKPSTPQPANLVILGPVTGGIQFHSPGASQNISVSDSEGEAK